MSSGVPSAPHEHPEPPAPVHGRRRARLRRIDTIGFAVPAGGHRMLGEPGDIDDALATHPGPGDHGFRPRGLPAGRALTVPGRGTTWVHESPGPPGAPTLVLLHGWTVTGALNWFPSFPVLARRFRVITIDHRGHGRGIRDHRRFRLEDCADDVASLADLLGVETFIPVGYSMGGPIAQLLWKRHRDRVSGLVLCATSRNFRGTRLERAVFSLFGGLSLAARLTPIPWRQELGARVALRRYDDSELGHWARREVARNDPRALIEAGHALGRYTSHDWIAEVDVPAGVLLTEHDTVVPPERQRRLATAIPRAEIYPVGGGHAVCVMGPETFVPALERACTYAAGLAGPSCEAPGTPA